MQKKIFNQLGILAFLLFVVSCQEDEPTLDAILVPSNLIVTAEVADDQSGNVVITPTADNALNYHVISTPGAEPILVNFGQSANIRFTQSGHCLLYTSPSPRDLSTSRMPSSA